MVKVIDVSLLSQFRNDCLSRQLEVKTANQYVSCVTKYLEQTGINSITELDRNDYLDSHDDLSSFNNYLVQERQLKWHSVNVYFNALENFFDFLVYFRHVRINPIPFYRKRCMRIYKDEEPEQSYVPKLKEMAEFVDSIDDPAIKAAVVMGSKCTLRLTEMLNQQYSHVDLEKNSAIVYKHKKRSNTLVFFDRETEDVLKDLIDQRKPKEYLFVQENGRPYSHETFRRHL